MAERKKSDASRATKNSLLNAAGQGFPYENFTAAAVLMPVSQSNSSILPEDVGEVDSFVGQSTPGPSAAVPPFAAPQLVSRPSPAVLPVSPQDSQRSHSPAHSVRSVSEPKATSFFSGVPKSSDTFTTAPTATVLPQPPSAAFLQSFSASSTSSVSSPLLTATNVEHKPTAVVTPNTGGGILPPPAHSSSSSPVPLFTSPSPVPLSQQADFFSNPPSVPTPPVASCPPFNQTSTPPLNPVPLSAPSTASLGSGANTYRLGAQRRPQYAQPPGLAVSAPALPIFSASPPLPTSVPDTVGPGQPAFPDPFSQSFSQSPAPSPFVPSPPLEIQSRSDPSSVASLSPSTSPFLTPTQTTSSFSSTPLLAANNSASAVPPPVSHHYTSSAASYFPTPIVAAATAMAATVAAASGPSQYQTPGQSTTEPSVLPPSFNNLSHGQPTYRPVYHHWFLKKEVESKVLWHPFSMADSLALEEAFTSTDISPDTLVPTDGGRYDVNILRRQRTAVYWDESPTEVRRCSWFFKGAVDSRYVPYEENVATRLEEEFKIAMTKNEWHRRVELANGETVVFHGPNVMVHFPQASTPDAWGNTPVSSSLNAELPENCNKQLYRPVPYITEIGQLWLSAQRVGRFVTWRKVPTRPRVVKRGVDEFNIEEGEPPKVDHLLFLVHGVGSACDLKFRSVVEVVDDFRSLSLQLTQSHFRTSLERGAVNRIEVLPVSWHSTLHGDDTGIDKKLKSITLPSIPKLRHFTNDTLLDILFYTSPVYCQTIIHTVGKEINRLYDLFKSRHPDFEGGVSLGGHSLGSLILFDLLCHQKLPVTPSPTENLPGIPNEDTSENTEEVTQRDPNVLAVNKVPPHLRKLNHRVSYVMGNAGTGQPYITYPQLSFHPKAFFAMGSPIGMFVTVRGIDALGEDFQLPTCPGFFNIFHPFDPVAYRIETLISPELSNLKPVVVPHHKGRKRMHLELRETMARVGADLKQKFLDSIKSTWNTVYQIAMFHRSDTNALEEEVDKVIEQQLHQQETESSHSEEADPDVIVGQLNSGRRVDYVLQEAPLESFNEYLFALGSHVCYWESEDTMLMILKEVYNSMGVSADSNVAHSNLTYEKALSDTSDLPSYQESLFATPSSSMSHFVGENLDMQGVAPAGESSGGVSPSAPSAPSAPITTPPSSQSFSAEPRVIGMDPTAPPAENRNLGPPPIAGFVRK